MPNYDGFVRTTPAHCDHNRDLFQSCAPCADECARYFVLTDRENGTADLACYINQSDGLWSSTLTGLSRDNVFHLTATFVNAGWTQMTATDLDEVS